MDRNTVKEKLIGSIRKYRYAVIIILVGVLLMVLPTKTTKNNATEPKAAAQEGIPTLEERLSQILSQVSGAGTVEVVLTLASGEETLYQTNEDRRTESNSTSIKTDTVTTTDSTRNETGLIRQINPPIYKGAVIVCQGADNAAVRLALVEAVGKATGLGADKISVLKMK